MKIIQTSFLLFLWLIGTPALAQQEDEVKMALTRLADHYKHVGHLSFDVQYFVSEEQSRGEYLDSLNGQYKISGSTYFQSIANTQTIFDSSHAVVVYNDDSLLYFARKPVNVATDFVPKVDSLINLPGVVYSVINTRKTKTIVLKFRESSIVKSVAYEISNRTGYLTNVTQVVNGKLLFDDESQASLKAVGYNVIETRFTNYSQKAFDTSILQIDRYVVKSGAEYIPSPEFSSYKIFVGSPNL